VIIDLFIFTLGRIMEKTKFDAIFHEEVEIINPFLLLEKIPDLSKIEKKQKGINTT